MSAISGTLNIDRIPTRPSAQMASGAWKCWPPRAETLETAHHPLHGHPRPENMWRRHPDNDTPDAWRDLVVSLEVPSPPPSATA